MPKKWDDCVKKVKKSSPKTNAYAICTKSTGLTRSGKRARGR